VIPQVVASEKGIAQTEVACYLGVVGLHLEIVIKSNLLESWAIACDSHVDTN
jgi:hypothetical protein